MENALLQLKEEQQVWSRLEDGSENNDNDDDIIVPHSANNDSSNHEERFEEMSNISTNPSEKIEANMKAVNSRDDPVVVFIRHGRTPHNKLALFTGWEDPPLAEEGEEDAGDAHDVRHVRKLAVGEAGDGELAHDVVAGCVPGELPFFTGQKAGATSPAQTRIGNFRDN